MVSADLVGADAQVVAWEAEDEDLKDAFRKGLKVHAKNALDMWGPDVVGEDGRREPYYTQIKSGVHGSNYGGSAYGIAKALGWGVSEAQRFQSRWFTLHPSIPRWHTATQEMLDGIRCWWCKQRHEEKKPKCENCGRFLGRQVGNRFGFRRFYFDRPDNLLPKALAWTPQSTVALCTYYGGLQIVDKYPWLEFLLQVHDELVFQIPYHRDTKLDQIKEDLNVVVPYSDPLIIPWTIKTSTVSWGDCA